MKFAIVGMGCRFPGSGGLDEFWKNLLDGHEARSAPTEWGAHPAIRQKYIGQVHGTQCFDPAPFGISHTEAASMDPEQRKLLEVTMDAIEDAGLRSSLRNTNVGVFVGGGMMSPTKWAAPLDYLSPTVCTSTAGSILANRVSYAMGFTGPSMLIDTACSSSAAALSVAVRCGRANDCDVMVVAGASAVTQPGAMAGFSKLGVLSETGCKPFSADADGYGRSSGWGAVLLKRLDLAVRDGDRVYAVVREVHTNQDGHNESLTMPCPMQQEALLRRCYPTAAAKEEVVYFEAHGTGTPVGDPREASAIAAAFVDREAPLPIGSVKGNIGHMECASAMGSIIKCALMLHHRTLVPSIRCATPSPHINWDRLHLQRTTQPITQTCPVIGVNSFGFGGSNVHIVLEGATERTCNEKAPPATQPWVLGAYDKTTLLALEQRWRIGTPSSYTMCCRSTGCPYILTAVGAHLPPSMGNIVTVSQQPKKLILAFCGQGAQYPAMGKPLANYAVYSDSLREISDHYRATPFGQTLGKTVLDVLLADDPEIHQIGYSMIGLFAHQVAVVQLLRSIGVEATAAVGHSVGEFAALWWADGVDLAQVVDIIALRASSMHDGQGSMMAVTDCPPIDDIPGLWVSCRNTPTSWTLGGTIDAIDQAAERCRLAGSFHRKLKVTNAYHTPLMDGMKAAFLGGMTNLDFRPRLPRRPLYSTVTGQLVTTAPTVASMWENIVSTVEFSTAVSALLDAFPDCVFVEPNPHPVLRGYLRSMAPVAPVALGRGLQGMLDGLVTLQALGHAVEWGHLLERDCPTAAPGYPFREIVFPSSETPAQLRANLDPSTHPLLGTKVLDLPDIVVYRTNLTTDGIPMLAGHRVQGQVVMPATAFIEACLAAGTPLLRGPAAAFTEAQNFQMKAALPIDTSLARATEIHVEARRAADGMVTVRITSGVGDKAVEHCSCEILTSGTATWAGDCGEWDDAVVTAADELYQDAAAVGLEYGADFQLLRRLTWSSCRGTGIGEIDASALTDRTQYTLDPRIMDDCLHACLFADMDLSQLQLPTEFGRIAYATGLVCLPPVVRVTVR